MMFLKTPYLLALALASLTSGQTVSSAQDVVTSSASASGTTSFFKPSNSNAPQTVTSTLKETVLVTATTTVRELATTTATGESHLFTTTVTATLVSTALGTASGNSRPGSTGAGTGATAGNTILSAQADPANGAFPGGVPQVLPDVPVTAVFLLLFLLGAATHISIYKANSNRGHKFLLSDLMFDFCVIRTLTCTFRIIWTFVPLRGIILVAQIFENGGAAVIFAVNLFFAQRIFRAIQPTIGWHPAFTAFSMFLIWSVPVVIILNIVSISISFFSVGNTEQLEATKAALRFGSCWNMMLSVIPLVLMVAAAGIPTTRRTENFGVRPLRVKVAALSFASAILAPGAAIRLTTSLNPALPDTDLTVFSKGTFYATGFLLEIIVVILYAVIRIDLLFYIPDGAKKPGDYLSRTPMVVNKDLSEMHHDIEEQLGLLGIQYTVVQPALRLDQQTELIIARLTAKVRAKVSPADEPRDNSRNDNRSNYSDTIEQVLPRRPERDSDQLEKP